MTDSMNFGPDWIRNLSSEGSTAAGGVPSGGTRYQLADYRYGREEMLALFDKNIKPPGSLTCFKSLYTEVTLPPLALLPTSEEERGWQSRTVGVAGPTRGRGGSLERGRSSRGRGAYQTYGRPIGYDAGWGNGEQTEWSPRKEYNPRTMSMDNWRRGRQAEDEDGWRNVGPSRGGHDKWGRSSSWRGEGETDERGGRPNWHENSRGPPSRRSWDSDTLPEWATENPTEGGGTFDERGAFHGSDDEQQSDGKTPPNRLQKSISQQHIGSKIHHQLSSSKSAMSLVKSGGDECKINEEMAKAQQREEAKANGGGDRGHFEEDNLDKMKCEEMLKNNEKLQMHLNGPLPESHRVDEEFERLQEDIVLKLVVDEDHPKQPTPIPSNFEINPGVQPPPNLVPPTQDKWFYQDPQGQMQGPFNNIEMAEWFKAGYFSNQLKVRRQCDERFFLLGELITMSGGANPFQYTNRFPVLKNDPSNIPEQDHLYFQHVSAAFKQAQARVMSEPWSALTLQQQELAAQRLVLQQQQVPQDTAQYMQQPPSHNPLMQLINQLKHGIDSKPPIDPHLQMQMLLQNRLHLPGGGGLPNNLPISFPPEPQQQQQQQQIIPPNIPLPMNSMVGDPQMAQMSQAQNDDNPIKSFLRQLQKDQQMDSLWQQQQQQQQQQLQAQPNWQQSQQQQVEQPPISMWDLQPKEVLPEVPEKVARMSPKDLKKSKELEEKLVKKEAEDRRKQEQRKQDAEKRAADEKKKKEEDRVRKELEKARKEAEDKRMKELEEKRKIKEQRKKDEEAKRKLEENKKVEDERLRREMKEQEERRLAEEKRLVQEQLRIAKAAPWCQSNSALGLSLAEIQKAEKEKRALEAAQQIHKQTQEQQIQQQQLQEKNAGIILNWANKPVEPRKVKSLAEIQAEEQEQLAKQATEARLQKEKEAPPVTNTASIWNSQNLNWASGVSASTTQWSSNNTAGFWEDSSSSSANKPVSKPSSVATTQLKNNMAAKPPLKEQQKPTVKGKTKSEVKTNLNNNNDHGSSQDEFTAWCFKSLGNISTNVDVPTFVTFLKDIESAFDVREYCKEYLGDSKATQQFATNFLEKRRSFKPKSNAHKDDMCSPAPAITPSMQSQHNADFQEVKGKNKKNKKSKMLKVDSRILGFNVTSAPDRINVGDRDYGDNS